MDYSIDRKEIEQNIMKKLPSLCQVHGVSGYEFDVENIVVEELKKYVDDYTVDPLGNIIGEKRGNGKQRLMIAAHMDEIGLMIKNIDENGFLYVEKVGGVRPQNLFSRTCKIKTQKGFVDGVINSIDPGRPRSITKIPDVNEFFIDVGAADLSEVEEMGIEVGNTVSINYEFKRIGQNKLMGKT